MVKKILITLYSLTWSSVLFGQHSVGNAGNPFDLMMSLSCERAAQMVLQYQNPDTTSTTGIWIEENRRKFAAELLRCDLRFTNDKKPINHPFVEENCALTNVYRDEYPQGNGDENTIYLSRSTCTAQNLDETKANQLLIHESVHHFVDPSLSDRSDNRISSEKFCDDVAAEVYRAWLVGQSTAAHRWSTDPTLLDAPERRAQHTAVWTGETGDSNTANRMLVWGGCSPSSDSLFECGKYFADGSAFNPEHNHWQAIESMNAPEERTLHTAIWTGATGNQATENQMIIWGGCNGDDACKKSLNSGAIYTPGKRNWKPTPIDRHTPEARVFHTAVWAGDRMITWGGLKGFKNPDIDLQALNSGGMFIPAADGSGYWQDMSSHPDQPSARMGHSAVWTGRYMIVWGGCDPEGLQYIYCRSLKDDGAMYDPVADEWVPLPSANAPSARRYHTAVWTGRYMIIWGGQNRAEFQKTGGIYDVKENKWLPMSHIAPTPRSRHVAVWTGSKMIIWGGSYVYRSEHQYPVDFGEYIPDFDGAGNDRWKVIQLNEHPDVAKDLTAVWTGHSMIVWGGNNYHDVYFDRGGTYHTTRWE